MGHDGYRRESWCSDRRIHNLRHDGDPLGVRRHYTYYLSRACFLCGFILVFVRVSVYIYRIRNWGGGIGQRYMSNYAGSGLVMTMRRLVTVLVATILWTGNAVAWDFLTLPNFPQRGSGHTDKIPWWYSGLTFYAPFDDPANPLRLIKGTGSFTFTRAHDATHTATFVHPTTGLVTTAFANQLRVEGNGALIEGVRTNIALYSDNLATAAWVKVNVSAAMNQTGPDGVANSASLITATGDGGTILQTVLSVSAAHSYAVWLKRVSGTGAVSITIDGTTWTEKTITSSWSRVSKENVTVLNPVIGIKLATSGDNVAVALSQLEVSAFSSSSIPTAATSMTRNTDTLTFPSSGNFTDAMGTVVVRCDLDTSAISGGAYILDVGSINLPLFYQANTIRAYDGAVRTGPDWASGSGGHWIGNSWGSGVMYLAIDGTISADLGSNGFSSSTMTIGAQGGSMANFIFGHVKNLRIWSRVLSSVEMVSVMQ